MEWVEKSRTGPKGDLLLLDILRDGRCVPLLNEQMDLLHLILVETLNDGGDSLGVS
jgi:hypothetical protein